MMAVTGKALRVERDDAGTGGDTDADRGTDSEGFVDAAQTGDAAHRLYVAGRCERARRHT